MTGRQQVPYPVRGACPVRGDDRVRVEVGRRPVDEDQGCACPSVREQVALVGGRRRNDQPVDPPGYELADECALPCGLLVDAPSNDRDAPRPRGVLDRTGDCSGPRIRQVLEDEPDGRRLAVVAAEAARRQVRPVVELLDRAFDAGEKVR